VTTTTKLQLPDRNPAPPARPDNDVAPVDDTSHAGRWWDGSLYGCVYRTIYDDPRLTSVVKDDALTGAWLHLLMAAEKTYPEPTPIPRRTDAGRLARLVKLGVIELQSGDRYTFRGLDLEREARKNRSAAGGVARAKQADRDDLGHFTKKEPSDAPSDAGQQATGTYPASLVQRSSRGTGTSTGTDTNRNALLRTTDDDERDDEKAAQDAALRASGILPTPPGLPTPERAGALLADIRLSTAQQGSGTS
jgi:hypothetical protein